MFENKVLTGDHNQVVNVLTRSQQRKNILEAMPKQAQDLLNFRVRRFEGQNSKEAELWLKDIEDWLAVNDLCLTGVFDLLLTEEAGILWKAFKVDSTTQEEAKCWFTETFMKKKSISEKIMELAEVKQKDDERFATFEIRVRKLLDAVFDPELSREDIVAELLSRRAKSNGLKETLITRPGIRAEEIRNLAKLYESKEQDDKRTEEAQVNALRQRNYVDALKRGLSEENTGQYSGFQNREGLKRDFRVRNNNFRSTDNERNQQNNVRYDFRTKTNDFRNTDNSRNKQYEVRYGQTGRMIPNNEVDRLNHRNPPSVSMKHIARKWYNKCRGLPPPREDPLQSNQCFCCGSEEHVRRQCPLRDKCLICGKNDHYFRACPLTEERSRPTHRQIMCIHDEEDSLHQDDGYTEELDNGKNLEDPIAHISSVGSF